jgi:hypothetical protein
MQGDCQELLEILLLACGRVGVRGSSIRFSTRVGLRNIFYREIRDIRHGWRDGDLMKKVLWEIRERSVALIV